MTKKKSQSLEPDRTPAWLDCRDVRKEMQKLDALTSTYNKLKASGAYVSPDTDAEFQRLASRSRQIMIKAFKLFHIGRCEPQCAVSASGAVVCAHCGKQLAEAYEPKRPKPKEKAEDL